MMKHVLWLVALLLLEAAVYLVGTHFELPWLTIGIIAGAVFLVWLVAYLVVTLLALKRSGKIEQALASQAEHQQADATGAAAQAALAEMTRQFESYLQALKASPTGRGSLATLPWYLVIGAPGSGKTTALQESGLAFSSMGHGVRSIRGIGGTKNCDWWFTDNAIFLDTAGRYTTQPEDQGEWLAFLDLIRETRGARPLHGILVVVSTADLIKGDASNLSATVRPIRERIAEVSARLQVVLPIYVVFSKADLVGGFKDFFAALDRAERDQVWGVTLTHADTAGKSPREVFAQQVAQLQPPILAKRLAALVGDRPRAQVTKACQFPGNFVSAHKWFGEFIGELFAPSGLPDPPIFRGFYFTSGIHVPRPGAPLEKADKSAAPVVPATQRTEVSFFFTPEQGQPVVEVAENRRGFFLKDLFGKVVVGDRGLAALPTRLVRRAALLRVVSFYGSLAAGILLLILTLTDVIATHHDLGRARKICGHALATTHADPLTQLQALDQERLLLTDLGARHSASAHALARKVQEVYYPQLRALLLDPALAAMGTRLEDLRRAPTKTLATDDEMLDLLRGYTMLGLQVPGSPRPDPVLLENLLRDQNRWYAGLVAHQALSPETQRLADAQLRYLLDHLTSSRGWQGTADLALVERARDAAGDVSRVVNTYADAEAATQGAAGQVTKATLVGDDDRGLIGDARTFSAIYTKDGYQSIFRTVLDERTRDLVDTFHQLGQDRSKSDIRRQLHTIYLRRYNQRYEQMLASLAPAPCQDLTQAANRLRQICGSDSPYRILAKNLKAAADVRIDDTDARVQLPTDSKWLEDGLTATVELARAVDDYTSATSPGARLADTAKLRTLAQAADKAASAYDAAVTPIEDSDARDACRKLLGNLITCVRVAAETELLAELDRTWQSTVRQPITEQLAGKYPLATGPVPDAPVATFAQVFNPKSGSFWTIIHQVEDLRHIRFGGADMIDPSTAYVRMLPPAKAMAEALFAGGAETLTIAATVTLEPRAGVRDLILALGTQKFRLYDRPDRRTQLTWKQGEPGGAKVSIQIATGQILTHDEPAPGWGILKLFRQAQPQDHADGSTRLTWAFPADNGAPPYYASILLEGAGLQYVISHPFFSIPDHLSQ